MVKQDKAKAEFISKQHCDNLRLLLDWYEENESGNTKLRLNRDWIAYFILLRDGSDGRFDSLSRLKGVTRKQAQRHVRTSEKNAKRYQECLRDLGLQD